jgi:glutathione S-transferase
VLELFQAEWCPSSHRVRQRLTELGVDFVARQVPVTPEAREELRTLTGGHDRVPVLVDESLVVTGAHEILSYLDRRFAGRGDAAGHRARALEAVPRFDELEVWPGRWKGGGSSARPARVAYTARLG